MAEGRKEATHSLRTEIEMMFKSDGALDLVDDIQDISDQVYDLTEPVKQLTQAFEGLNASPVKDLVKTLENFSLDSVAVDAGNLREVLENKIASAITKSTIEFIGDEGTERYPFKVKMGAEFWEKNEKNVMEAMAKSFSNFEVDVSDVPPLDNRAVLEEFQTKFNEQIVELIKDEDIFSLYKTNKDGIKKYKYKKKFTLDEAAAGEIMGAIEKEFVNVLTDPKNIIMEDIPKLNINSTELKQAMLKIQDSIGDIDSLVGVDVDTLKDLPNIEDKLITFRNNLDLMVRQINTLAVQLESITVGKATEEDMKQAIKAIDNLKENTTLQLNKWIEDVALVVDSHLKVRPSLDGFKDSINTLNEYFDTTFQKQMELLKEDMGKVLNNIQSKEGGEGKDILEGKKIDITQAILDVITENLLEGEIPIELDTELVDGVLLGWSEDLSVAVMEELDGFTTSILKNIAEAFESVSVHVDSAIKILTHDLDTLFTEDDVTLDNVEDLKGTITNLQKDIYAYLVESLMNTTIIGIDDKGFEFELPKSFQRDIKQIVDKNIREYTMKITKDYKAEEFDGVGVDESIERLDKHTTMIVNAVMREVNQTLTNIRKEFLQKDTGWMDSTKNLKETFDKNIRALTGSYIRALEDSINTIIVTEDAMDHIQKQISNHIKEGVGQANIDLTPSRISLDSSYTAWVKAIEDAFKISLDQWSSKVSLGGMINEAKLSEAINNKIRESAQPDIDIDLVQSTKKALEQVEKSVNDVIDKTMDSIKNAEIEEVELNIKTKRLQNNINNLIQKIVNEKAKQITAYGNQLVGDIDTDEGVLQELKESIGNILDSTITGYSIAAQTLSSQMHNTDEINVIYTKMVNGLTESFSMIMDTFLDGLDIASKGQFSIPTNQIHPKLRKAMANSLDMNVRDFVKAHPEIKGDDAQKILIQKNVELITNAVNDAINTSIRQVVTSYEDSIKQVEINPDTSLVGYIYDRLIELQDTIVSRAKKMVREQFRYLTEEIKEMNIEARSMGYRPTKAFTREVTKATGAHSTATGGGRERKAVEDILGDADITIGNASISGTDILADQLNIDGQNISIPEIGELKTNASSVIVDGQVVDLDVSKFPIEKLAIPIENLLTKQPLFSLDPAIDPYISDYLKDLTNEHLMPSNVYSRGYNPLDLNKILFEKEVEPYKGLFEGITKNMAKYFMVGYMMRLPIKAVTEANKIAAELDYHLAKARQNIMIKDPQMTTTAQRVVYDKYQAEGRDTTTKEFREDVNKEAANLRNMMSNEMSNYLLNISKAYYQEIADVGRYYSIASRKSRDPYEALTKTREIAKIAAVEEDLDTDFAASGLEALSAQWGIHVGELDRYTNMLLKTAMLSNTTVTDLLMAQRDTAAMFKSRLAGIEGEEAFATAMALSSMFVQATGKSGRESGTFWRYVLQRPYVKDSRKFLEQAAQLKGFEDLDPYHVDETGKRVQKDFLTMFSNILETTIKVDDPSAMTVLSEVFPIRTIGGAESVSALVQDLKIDLEKSITILKDMGELDEDATIDTVDIKEVIEKYIGNIMEVTDEDIGMYLAGLQDTTQFAAKGLYAQWQSTVYSIFRELKEETSAAMTYFTAILRKFEENSYQMSEVIGIFMKLGAGYLGKDMVNRVVQKGLKVPVKPTEVQKELAYKYTELQAIEKSLDLRRKAIEGALTDYQDKAKNVLDDINTLEADKKDLDTFILDLSGKEELSYEDKRQLDRATKQQAMYDDQLIKLRNTYDQLDQEVYKLASKYSDINKSYGDAIELGGFLKGSMGAKNVDELKDSFANYLRNGDLYNEIAPMVIRSTLEHDDEWYDQLYTRKNEIEEAMLQQQRDLLQKINKSYRYTSPEELRNILGEGYGDEFYAMEHRVSEGTIKSMKDLFDHFGDEYADMRKNFDNTHKELNAINSELIGLNTDRLEVERAIFEATRPQLTGYAKADGMDVPQFRTKTKKEIMEDYRSLLPAFGINIDEFEGGMDALSSMFKDGSFDVDTYEDALKDVAVQLGVADRDFDRFKLTVMELNTEIKKGKKDIYEYIAALDTASTKGGRLKGLQGEAIPQTLSETGKEGITDIGWWGRLMAKVGGTSLGMGLVKLGGKVGATKLGTLGKGLAVGLKGLATKLPQIGLMYATISSMSSVLGGITERGMTEAERMSLEADKLERHINKATGWKIDSSDKGIKKIGKYAANYVGAVWSGTMNQLNRWVGGTAPSFKETWNMRREAMKYPELTDDELRAQMKEMYEVELKRAKANYERQKEYLEKNPFVDPFTGELRSKDDPYFQVMPLEDLMEFLDKKMKELNKSLTESDALFTREKVKILISGLSNNSQEMRDAIKEHLNRNIEEMTRLVGQLRDYLPNLVPGSEAYTGMHLQILDLENRIAEAELQKFETDFSAFDEIMERYNRESSKIQSRYDIKKYDAVLQGIKKDSSALRQIEKNMADEQVKMMSGIQSRLEGLRQQYADKPDQQERILIQIQQLEADKKRILADIKDQMSEGLSTFNLPTDIKPITYYEAVTRNNTHKNMTVRAGDATVNVNIDNMSGTDTDVERLSKAVSSAVAQAQKNFVRQFANDVKSGMGNNYYSWNNY